MRQEARNEEHVHQWIFVRDDDQDGGMMICRVCGAMRLPNPGEAEMLTARELRIRHDGEESDL